MVVSPCCNPDYLQCPCGAQKGGTYVTPFTVELLLAHRRGQQSKCKTAKFGPAVDIPVDPAPATPGGPAIMAVEAYLNCCGVHHADWRSGEYKIPGHEGVFRIKSPSEILQRTPAWELADIVQQSKILAQEASVFPAKMPERGAQKKLTQLFPRSVAAKKVTKEDAGAGNGKEEVRIDSTHEKEEDHIDLTDVDDMDMGDVYASPQTQGSICGSAATKRKDKPKSDKQGLAHQQKKKAEATKKPKMTDFFKPM